MSRAYGTPLDWTGETFDFATAEQRALTIFKPYVPTVLWRVEACRYSYTIDADAERYGVTDPRLELFALPVLKFTPCGARLVAGDGLFNRTDRGRWVDLRPDAKQYASRTPAEAVEQFAARRRAQLYILAKQTDRAERELALCRPAPFLMQSR